MYTCENAHAEFSLLLNTSRGPTSEHHKLLARFLIPIKGSPFRATSMDNPTDQNMAIVQIKCEANKVDVMRVQLYY